MPCASKYLLASALLLASAFPAHANWKDSLPATDMLNFVITEQAQAVPAVNPKHAYKTIDTGLIRGLYVEVPGINSANSHKLSFYVGSWKFAHNRIPKVFFAFSTATYKPLTCQHANCSVFLQYRNSDVTQVLDLVQGDLNVASSGEGFGASYYNTSPHTALLLKELFNSAQGKIGNLVVSFRDGDSIEEFTFDTAGIDFAKVYVK